MVVRRHEASLFGVHTGMGIRNRSDLPLSVGEEPVKKIQTIEKKGRKLKLLSPTDCVKDRLAAYYHWNDRPSLEQAVMVSFAQSVDLKEIERWSSNEGMAEKYPDFLEDLDKSRP